MSDQITVAPSGISIAGFLQHRSMSLLQSTVEAAFAGGNAEIVRDDLQDLCGAVGDDLNSESKALIYAWIGRACHALNDIQSARRYMAAAISLRADLPDWVRAMLQEAAWRAPISAEEEIPSELRADVEAFGQFITDFLRTGTEPPVLFDDRHTAATLAWYWVHHLKTVVADASDDSVQKCQLARTFTDAVAKGFNGVFDHLVSTGFLPFDIANPSPRITEIAATVALRGKPILCPFTGEGTVVKDSLDPSVYLHRVGDRVCLVISEDTAAAAASDRAWYFVDTNLLFCAVRWGTMYTTLARALTRVFENRSEVAAYLAESKPRPVMVYETIMGHLGHYVWNTISGWPRLLAAGATKGIDIVALHRNFKIFGGAQELYPDVIEQIPIKILLDSEDQAYQGMLSNRALCLLLTDNHITGDLAHRIISWCYKNCSTRFANDLFALWEQTEILLLVTLRLENRAWIGQEEGLPSIINALAADFPKIGIILDGVNSDIAQLSSHSFMSKDDEVVLAESIIRACPGVRIYNAVGCSVAEGIMLCDIADAFLAPVGAGMAKYRWITNKPGVAYSNEMCLQPNSIDGHLYEHHRDDLTKMYYVPASAVKDIETERHGEPFRANFLMNWEPAYEQTRELLTEIKKERSHRTWPLRIWQVEFAENAWCVRKDNKLMPILFGKKPVAAFNPGWEPKFVYAGLEPFYLLELVHSNGAESTWYLDSRLERIGGDVGELSNEVQAALSLRCNLNVRDDEDAPGLPDYDGFTKLNAATKRALRALREKRLF